jgi:type II secretory pathway pseudopilin PulG
MIERVRKRIAAEEGFTILECLVAAIILTLGSLAVFMTFIAAIHNVKRSTETQFGISVAQREMEWVRAHPFEDIALDAIPAAAGNPTTEELNPLDRVLPGQAEFSVDREQSLANTTGNFSNTMPFVDDIAGGFSNSKPVKYLEGSRGAEQVQATVYRFVLCEEKEVLATNCDKKRIVIDVVPKLNITEHNRQRNYYELQSTIINPAKRSAGT